MSTRKRKLTPKTSSSSTDQVWTSGTTSLASPHDAKTTSIASKRGRGRPRKPVTSSSSSKQTPSTNDMNGDKGMNIREKRPSSSQELKKKRVRINYSKNNTITINDGDHSKGSDEAESERDDDSTVEMVETIINGKDVAYVPSRDACIVSENWTWKDATLPQVC
jgi:hypothetical protein